MSATALTKESGREPLATLPEELASPAAKLVYLYLATADGGTIDELHEALGMSNIALYPILDSLIGRDLVTCDGEEYRAC